MLTTVHGDAATGKLYHMLMCTVVTLNDHRARLSATGALCLRFACTVVNEFDHRAPGLVVKSVCYDISWESEYAA